MPRKDMDGKRGRVRRQRSPSSRASYSCPDCHRIFSEPWNLKTHRRIHSGARPYPCRLGCGLQLMWMSSRNTHERKCAASRGPETVRSLVEKLEFDNRSEESPGETPFAAHRTRSARNPGTNVISLPATPHSVADSHREGNLSHPVLTTPIPGQSSSQTVSATGVGLSREDDPVLNFEAFAIANYRTRAGENPRLDAFPVQDDAISMADARSEKHLSGPRQSTRTSEESVAQPRSPNCVAAKAIADSCFDFQEPSPRTQPSSSELQMYYEPLSGGLVVPTAQNPGIEFPIPDYTQEFADFRDAASDYHVPPASQTCVPATELSGARNIVEEAVWKLLYGGN